MVLTVVVIDIGIVERRVGMWQTNPKKFLNIRCSRIDCILNDQEKILR